jgi:hypothetical protein
MGEVYRACTNALSTTSFGAFVPAGPLLADDVGESFCPFALHEERTERDDLALELDLARSILAASEEIFELVDRLSADEAIQRLRAR